MLRTSLFVAILIITLLSISVSAQTAAPGEQDRLLQAGPHGRIPPGMMPAQAEATREPARRPEPEARQPHPASDVGPAAGAAPTLSVDAAAGRHFISPYVYGINSYVDQPSTIKALSIPITRWGGDATSEYNWQTDKTNVGADWYFEVWSQSNGVTPAFDPVTYNNSAFDRFHLNNQINGAISIGTIPIMGWVAGNFPDHTCGYSVKKYGAQQNADGDCGNGKDPSGNPILTNDPHDTDVTVTPSVMTQWVQHVVGVFGPASRGGVKVWEMDNEPVWWNGVHQSVHPSMSTFDEVTNDGLAYAAAVKAGDPTAAVAGPITAGWWDLFFSHVDLQSGWNTSPWKYWDNPTDRNAHGGIDFVAYYLQQFAKYQQQHGVRLLDYFDIHGYMPGTNLSDINGNEDLTDVGKSRRLLSTRLYWDSSLIPYSDPKFSSWVNYSGATPYTVWDEYLLGSQWQQCLCLIPRMKAWVNANYPGTKLGITEYYLGGQDDISGILAQADLLGIFGREGLDYATWWPFHTVTATSPGGFSFRMYRNYNGRGGTFGNMGISAQSSDQDQLSIYGAESGDQALTLMVINKTAGDLITTVALKNSQPAGPVHVYQYTSGNMSAIVQLPDLAVSLYPFYSPPFGIQATFPAYSMTLLVVPESGEVYRRTPRQPRPVAPGKRGSGEIQ